MSSTRSRSITFSGVAEPRSFDLVIAADVFIYIGELDETFCHVGRLLRPGGWFAFSTEERGVDDYVLLPTGRYAQSQAYVRRLASHGFSITVEDTAVIRLEGGMPLMGRLYLLQKNSDG